MGNFFKNLKPHADLSRHGFDLSQRHVFSTSAGLIQPVLNIPCVPNDFHQIRVSDLLRAMPIQTAAFTRCKQVVDFFFVPYVQLWHRWPDFINQRQDQTSSYFNTSLPIYAPHFDLGDLIQDLVINNSQESNFDSNGFNKFVGSCRLLDLLGYCNLFPFMDRTSDIVIMGSGFNTSEQAVNAINSFSQDHLHTNYNLWPILAYNKIWSDFYRNPYWDTSVEPSLFNVDNITGVDFDSAKCSSELVARMFELRYHSWKKDYFTSLLPTQQFGDVSVVNFGLNNFVLSSLNKSTAGNLYGKASSDGGEITSGPAAGPIRWSATSVISNTTPELSVLALRRAEALQVWKEKVLRAGYRSADNYEAHFGVRPNFESDNHPVFLGSVSQPLTIDDVTATAQTDASYNNALGDLGGKGVSFVDSDTIEFRGSDYGVLMAMHYIIPETEYNSFGVDKDKCLLEPFDYFTPEYQNLGLEPVVSTELSMFKEQEDLKVIGYAPRYYCYKSSYDKVHGVFCHEPLSAPGFRGVFRHWVSPLDRFQNFGIALPDGSSDINIGMSNPYNQYVTPSVLDSIFYNRYDGSIIKDQFVVDMNFSINSVRPMSVLGLPNV